LKNRKKSIKIYGVYICSTWVSISDLSQHGINRLTVPQNHCWWFASSLTVLHKNIYE